MELNKRLVTGIILGLVSLFAIFKLDPANVSIFLAVFFSFAAWEWASMMRLKWYWRASYVLLLIALFHVGTVLSLCWLGSFGILWIFFGLFMLLPMSATAWIKHRFCLFWLGLFFLLPCWWIACKLQREAPFRLLFVFLLATLSDTGAYYVGRHFGKHKLAPTLSPQKTWEGFLGGAVVATVAACVMYVFLPSLDQRSVGMGLMVSSLVIVAGAVGDLFESFIKRHMNVKNSGSILPGHGGMLDRIDSLCAALPVYVLLLCWLN